VDAENEGVNLTILEAYPRQYLKMMYAKYCDMTWAPAWIVKDKSRQLDGGSYAIPELTEYHEMACEGLIAEAQEVLDNYMYYSKWCIEQGQEPNISDLARFSYVLPQDMSCEHDKAPIPMDDHTNQILEQPPECEEDWST